MNSYVQSTELADESPEAVANVFAVKNNRYTVVAGRGDDAVEITLRESFANGKHTFLLNLDDARDFADTVILAAEIAEDRPKDVPAWVTSHAKDGKFRGNPHVLKYVLATEAARYMHDKYGGPIEQISKVSLGNQQALTMAAVLVLEAIGITDFDTEDGHPGYVGIVPFESGDDE